MQIKWTTRLKVAFLIFLIVEAIGTVGVFLLEGPKLIEVRKTYTDPVGTVLDSLVDSFWITTTIITGLGAEGYVPGSKLAKLFSSFLAILGTSTVVGSIVYLFGPVVYEGIKEVSGLSIKISSLSHHAIICGYNPISDALIETFRKTKEPYIITTEDSKEVSQLLERGLPAICGDSTKSDFLKKIRIDKADILIAVEDEDNTNALIVLTARHLRKDLKIIGKVESEENIEKLKNAGADHVFCPAVVGGREIAKIAIKLLQKK